METTMRAMVIDTFGSELQPREMPVPVPAPDEVLISVEACGVCRTDLKVQAGVFDEAPLPFVPGHEIAGRVVAAGGPAGESLVGSPVVVPLAWTCGDCDACARGADHFCVHVRRPGFTVDGGLRDFMCVPAAEPIVIPDGMDPTAAALLPDCISTVHHAIGRAGILSGERVLVIGAGGLGIHAVQLLIHAGAEVTVSEPDAAKRQLALDHGAAEALTPDELAAIPPSEGRFGVGYAAAFDFAGNAASTASALDRLIPDGRLVLVGYTPGDTVASDVFAMVLNERRILGSRASNRVDIEATLELVTAGAVEPVVSRTYPLDAANEALNNLAEGAVIGRAVIDLTDDR